MIPSAADARSAVDTSAYASPVNGPLPGGEHIPGGVDLRIHLSREVDSGTARNGEMIPGVLETAVRTSTGQTIAAGTPISATVVVALPAGKLHSAGEMTLQVVKVGDIHTFSELVTYHGEIGKRDMPDSNPEKGTEARVDAGALLTFKVPPPPTF